MMSVIYTVTFAVALIISIRHYADTHNEWAFIFFLALLVAYPLSMLGVSLAKHAADPPRYANGALKLPSDLTANESDKKAARKKYVIRNSR